MLWIWLSWGLLSQKRQIFSWMKAIRPWPRRVRFWTEAGLKEFIQEKLVCGIPAQTIAREAEAQQAALIFMGSVGHSALTRFVIGSVTNSVIHLVRKPAVAVVYP